MSTAWRTIEYLARERDTLKADLQRATTREMEIQEDYSVLKADNERLREALRGLVEAEWMVTHDWGGDRLSVLDAARAALAEGKGEGR